MGRSMGRLAFVSVLIALAILFGMELADDGIRTVYGPVGDSAGVSAADGAQAANDERAAQRSRYYAEEPQGIAYEGGSGVERSSAGGVRGGERSGGQERDTVERETAKRDPYAIPRPDGEPLVDSLADKTASALQALSQGGVRAVVSLFDKLSGS
ncbi:hypothetical protein [Cohnella sp. 56]|uniref:hypothetical protein n=1 Tax=Cohnella sp. 56 TaxID=3113722 RepID=UPI0030EAA2E3